MFGNFSLQLNMAKRRHVFFFSTFCPETEEQLAKNKIRLDLWFESSHLEVVKNLTIHFISKLLI